MRKLILGLGIAAYLAHAPFAAATVVKAHSLAEKTNKAQLIVRAQVESIQTEWVTANARAQTVIRLKITEALKGKIPKSKRILVRQAGGKIGNFDHRVDGVSRWETSEEVIMFLETVKDRKRRPMFVELGIGIGKYEIKGNKKEQWVHHHPHVALATVSPGQAMQIEVATEMKPVRLETFLNQVRDFISGKRNPHKRLRPSDKASKQGMKREVKQK